MDGRARAAKREADLLFWQAWHVEAFARMSGRDFKAAIKKIGKPKRPRKQSPAEMLAILRQFEAGGAPMKITDIN